MCGIVGFTFSGQAIATSHARALLGELLILSESRGKEASGVAFRTDAEIRLMRTPFPASDLVHSNAFVREFSDSLTQKTSNVAAIGHSRLVTNGYEHENHNNQPVVSGVAVAVHNGIIVNHREIWDAHPTLNKQTDLDSEIITALVNHYAEKNIPLHQWMPLLFDQIKGMTTTAILMADRPELILATNNGSLYYAELSGNKGWVFASERHFLESAFERHPGAGFRKDDISHLEPGTTLVINVDTQVGISGKLNLIPQLTDNSTFPVRSLPVVEVPNPLGNRSVKVNRSMEYSFQSVPKELEQVLEKRLLRISGLKRCTRCILPESFPFITFDTNGVCNYCHGHIPIGQKGEEALTSLAEGFRSNGHSSGYDCLVPFSGGRDSSYALHYLVKELGMRPLAFSYDWGMLTDLGRRNQSRMCGALGVEHILVSADIRKKRDNIRKNVSAWLKRPHLGTIPLFMAGDKQYFFHTARLMAQHQLQLSVMGENMLETTRFKTGFCGIPPHFSNDHTYSIPVADKARMMLFYGKEYLLNPAYINTSLLDTLDAFRSYYVMKHENLNIFDYLPWDEQKIERTLLDGYDWETDPETSTTWRIGDGTAAFYNYIYYVVTGFTENDTFRSNQIREGQMSREDALLKVEIENQPRWKSIQWYCNTIGIDWEKAISIINGIQQLY
jgi:glucosamine--fructose-6-phosphate aminotransferase (isomerizing)